MTGLVIALAGVEKSYRFFKLTDLGLRLDAGQIMGLVGANGAGKSTTIRMLMGLVRRIAATSACSDTRCRANRLPPNAISASCRKTCASTAARRSRGTCAWSPPSIPVGTHGMPSSWNGSIRRAADTLTRGVERRPGMKRGTAQP